MSNGFIRAECRDCDWTYSRSLDAGETFSLKENQAIANRVIRTHEFKCGCDGDESRWGERSDVDREIDVTGGIL